MKTRTALSHNGNEPNVWENRSAPGRCGNTTRGLTHSLDSTKEGPAMKATRICTLPDCDGPVESRYLCSKHYARLRRYGDPIAVPPSRKPDLVGRRFGTLTVVADAGPKKWHCVCDCGATTISRAWNLANGLINSCGASVHKQKQGEVSYFVAHKRLRSARGRAADYECVDCGGAAHHWSYDNTDPNALAHGRHGAYSLDPARYQPRCSRCHGRFDAANRKARIAAAPKCSECGAVKRDAQT